MRWHERNEAYLVDRRPIASVGVLWSQENVDFYGREAPESRVMAPYWGTAQALIRARIPYLPVHADDIGGSDGLAVLVLPNVGALSDSQCEAIRRFVAAGGGLVATGETSLYDALGERRIDFALADILGAHATGDHAGSLDRVSSSWDAQDAHSYLRLRPELRARVDGPLTGLEPPVASERHATLTGFDETDIYPSWEAELVVPTPSQRPRRTTAVRLPSADGVLPPEAETQFPALVLSERSGLGRVVYLPASLDYAFAAHNLPDHGQLLANLVRWTAAGRLPLRVSGMGLVDCHLYQQSGRLILHIVNLHNRCGRPPLP